VKEKMTYDTIPRGSIIGMVHLLPLPGVPGASGMSALLDRALSDVDSLLAGGVDGLLIENMHDFPCVREREMGPEVAATLAVVGGEIRRRVGPELPIGIQVLFAANRTAVAVAAAAGLNFIRAEGWTYGHLSDKGWVEASAGAVVRYRKQIEAEQIALWADVKKKHASHAITADLSLAEQVENIALHRADGVIITGSTTGEAPTGEDVQAAEAASPLPVVLGSGVTAQNISRYQNHWHAVIVGSSLKESGDWRRPVDRERVRQLVEARDVLLSRK
jgi:membrane complex biogenesis BtpA family protein